MVTESDDAAKGEIYISRRFPLTPYVEGLGESFRKKRITKADLRRRYLYTGVKDEDSTQPERYILTAYLANWAFDRSIRNRELRPPYGLVYGEIDWLRPGYLSKDPKVVPFLGNLPDPNNPNYKRMVVKRITKTTEDLNTTLNFDLLAEIYDIQGKPLTDFRRRVVERLGFLTSEYSFFHGLPSPDCVYQFIIQGNGTATKVIKNILGVIPELYRAKYGIYPDLDELTRIGSNSYSLMMKLASGSREIVPELLNKLDNYGRRAHFDPKDFVLLTAPEDQTRVEIPQATIQKIWEGSSKSLSLDGRVTTGCPAVISSSLIQKSSGVQGESKSPNIIKGLLDWELAILGTSMKPTRGTKEKFV